MRKFFVIIRYLMIVLLIILIGFFIKKDVSIIVKYVKNIDSESKVILMFISIVALIIISIFDVFSKKFKIRNSFKYTLINIIGLFPICLFFARVIFDKTLVFNTMLTSSYNKEYFAESLYTYLDYNSFVITAISILIIVYRIINTEKVTKHKA